MLAMYLSLLETETDQENFIQIFEQYEKLVYKIALRISGTPSLAEDAAQQTWLHLIRCWARVKEISPNQVGGYISTCAKNATLDILRIENRTVPFPQIWDPPARDNDESGYEYLISLIRSLPDRYKRVLELKYVEENTNREIARRLNIKESTVATRISRGKILLKESLQKEGFQDGQL